MFLKHHWYFRNRRKRDCCRQHGPQTAVLGAPTARSRSPAAAHSRQHRRANWCVTILWISPEKRWLLKHIKRETISILHLFHIHIEICIFRYHSTTLISLWNDHAGFSWISCGWICRSKINCSKFHFDTPVGSWLYGHKCRNGKEQLSGCSEKFHHLIHLVTGCWGMAITTGSQWSLLASVSMNIYTGVGQTVKAIIPHLDQRTWILRRILSCNL